MTKYIEGHAGAAALAGLGTDGMKSQWLGLAILSVLALLFWLWRNMETRFRHHAAR